ncbi:MAG: inositol monophosphatase, partial [Armatimonadetes bacterium]|nr:inositol monophosphatase [Armatimonadota bacterium]
MEEFSPFLQSAIEVARRTGWMLRDLQSRPFAIDFKGGRDLVTAGDRAAEEMIIKELRARYPGHGFLAEEKVKEEGPDYRWVIDPIDGTTNFAHRMPWW